MIKSTVQPHLPYKLLCIVLGCLLVTACSAPQPKNISNVCEIYDEYYDWYLAADGVEKRWGIPAHVTMAFIHQESRFIDDARPPWEWFLWIIPTGRASSAYGYAQALDETWDEYRSQTKNWGADRDDFEDAVDFVGWYNSKSIKRNRISRHDAYRLYLAYHEGQGGYARGTYKGKNWLLAVAKKVERKSKDYRQQLTQCRAELEDNRFWRSMFGDGYNAPSSQLGIINTKYTDNMVWRT